VFDHLAALTDDRGLFEHALHATPRREHGYCVDDAARGLVVTSRERSPGPVVQRLHHRYLSFVLAALSVDGTCHNRMDPGGRWSDVPGLGDWWGRALWGLGVAATLSPEPGQRARALAGFRVAAQQRSPHPRAAAYAALGAGELVRARTAEPAALAVLGDAVRTIGRQPTNSAWPWPEPRLSYANATIAEALMVAGEALADEVVLARGLELLTFLMRVEVREDHLSVTPVAVAGLATRVPASISSPSRSRLSPTPAPAPTGSPPTRGGSPGSTSRGVGSSARTTP